LLLSPLLILIQPNGRCQSPFRSQYSPRFLRYYAQVNYTIDRMRSNTYVERSDLDNLTGGSTRARGPQAKRKGGPKATLPVLCPILKNRTDRALPVKDPVCSITREAPGDMWGAVSLPISHNAVTAPTATTLPSTRSRNVVAEAAELWLQSKYRLAWFSPAQRGFILAEPSLRQCAHCEHSPGSKLRHSFLWLCCTNVLPATDLFVEAHRSPIRVASKPVISRRGGAVDLTSSLRTLGPRRPDLHADS
jgi:hypothetical protein